MAYELWVLDDWVDLSRAMVLGRQVGIVVCGVSKVASILRSGSVPTLLCIILERVQLQMVPE